MNQKEIIWISVTVFLTILAWMLLDLYKVKTQTTVDSGLRSVQTVDFVIKPEMLDKLKEMTP